MDFALILVVATALTGLIWLLDTIFLLRRRQYLAAGGEDVREPIVVEYAKSFFPVLLIVLLLRSFLFEPFRIPSGSMMPTLLEGDFIFVNKFSYGLRLPVTNTKIVDIGDVERGDVVVFRKPSEPSVNYIKRVVGLPGDTVHYNMERKELTINGQRVGRSKVGPYPENSSYEVHLEQLGEVEHNILLAVVGGMDEGGTYRVPAGMYFMMGDNRDNSSDSRTDDLGLVPEGNLVGRAVLIWMNWRKPSEGGPRWSRIGDSID